jgi:alkaline phosphatase D
VSLPVDPFTLGVASGDPWSDSVVLWTRLAVDPIAGDGLGGMPRRDLPVQWQVAAEDGRVVRSGVTTARAEDAHSVHVEVGGLRAGTAYHYRFRLGDHISPAGRTGTVPGPGATTPLTVCAASCAHFGEGFFTAYRRLAEDHPDLIVHLGDYQYEYAGKLNDVRPVAGPETRTLAGYRQRYAQYKTDPDLQLAHATAPWLVVWDDHEVQDNWAGPFPVTPDPAFPARRAAAARAYYENMPLRHSARPHGTAMRLYRRFAWGDLATMHMLDTRQYRDDQACGGGRKAPCPESLAPARTITGAAQQRWLLDGLRGSRARWDVLGQQVFFGQRDTLPGPGEAYEMDTWDGYRANRDRVARALGGARNGVVLTGDVHRHWAGDITVDGRGVGVELVATSVTTTGDGDEETRTDVLADNPNLKFYKNRRGYVRTRFTDRELRADFRILPFVRDPDAPATTAASFVVEDRDPRLHSVR